MKLFSLDSPFMKFMDRLVDVALLNLLWLVSCLPLITAGAATTAAFKVLLAMVADEEGPLVRSYFRAFRANLVKGSLLGLLAMGAVYVVLLDWDIVATSTDTQFIPLVVGLVSTVLAFGAFVHAFALNARYDNSVVGTIINSLRICARFPGRTLGLALVLILELGLFLWNVPLMIAGIIVGPMILMYTIAANSRHIFTILDAKESP